MWDTIISGFWTAPDCLQICNGAVTAIAVLFLAAFTVLCGESLTINYDFSELISSVATDLLPFHIPTRHSGHRCSARRRQGADRSGGRGGRVDLRGAPTPFVQLAKLDCELIRQSPWRRWS